MYGIVLSDSAKKDYLHWLKSGNVSIVKRIRILLTEISEHPFSGAGKPEPLKYGFSGMWSRRINEEHRIIYEVNSDSIEVHILSMRYHYSKK